MALTNEGYKVKRLAEIKRDFALSLTNKFGPVNVEADSVIGQLQGIWAEALANLYEQAQNTYHAMYPFSAEGSDLDGAVSYVGIRRIAAAPTQVIAAVYGRESTLLKGGALASDGNKRYQSAGDSVISRANCIDGIVDIDLREEHQYSLNINGIIYHYYSKIGDTVDQIMNEIGSQLDSEKLLYSISGQQLRITAKDGVTAFAISTGEGFNLTKIGSPARFVAEDSGRQILPTGALNEIVTPRSGWDGVGNLVAGSVGRERETDEELRIRFEKSREVVGSATVRALRARLMQEANVREVNIFENRSGEVSDDGIPGHAIEAVVAGGDNQKVAETLWKYKPAGIETHGSLSFIVKDDNSDGQQIRFSRPQTKLAWIKVSVNKLYEEETLSDDVITSIRQAIVQFGNQLNVGEDIILQRFFGPVYQNTHGIGAITIEAALTDTIEQRPEYQMANLPIGRSEIALFDLERVEVSGL
jgi:uncharacterized phage protein gp47/JayE